MPSTKIPFFLIYFIVLVVLDSLSIVKTMKSYRQIRRSPMKRNMMHTRNKSFRIYQAGSSSSYSVKFRSMQRGLGAPSSPLRYNRLFSKLHNEAGNLHNKLPLDELLPDRSVYSKFFHACTASASSIGIDIDTFCKHDDIRMLISEDLITLEDIKRFWLLKAESALKSPNSGTSSSLDNSQNELGTMSEEDSYDILCQVISLIESTTRQAANNDETLNSFKENNRSANNSEMDSTVDLTALNRNDDNDFKYLEKEFLMLANGKPFISYNTFFQWEETQALFADGVCTPDEIIRIWQTIVGDLKTPCNRSQFVEINILLDEYVGIDDEGEDESNLESGNDGEGVSNSVPVVERSKLLVSEDKSDVESNDVEAGVVVYDNAEGEAAETREQIDVWNLNFDPASVIERDFMEYLKDYFQNYCNEQGLISFNIWIKSGHRINCG